MTRKLFDWAVGKKIVDGTVYRDNGRYDIPNLKDYYIHDLRRRGKQIIFDIGKNARDTFLVCHNAMTGYWDTETENWTFDYVEGKRNSNSSDVRVDFKLDDGTILRFHDARLFGSFKTFKDRKTFDKLGAEAIDTERLLPNSPVFNVLDAAVFFSEKKPIKQLLMEQHRIAGVGNIYAVEALWRAQISPLRLGDSLVGSDMQSITESLQEVLKQALECGLQYDKYLKVYRRKNCSRCGSKIKNDKLEGRSTYWCSCQK